jgi:hypothetical protein
MLFRTASVSLAQAVEAHYLWRGRLRDANDDMVLDAAINAASRCDRNVQPERFWSSRQRIRNRDSAAARRTEENCAMKTPTTYPLRLPASIRAEAPI